MNDIDQVVAQLDRELATSTIATMRRISVHGPATKLKVDPAVKAAYLGGSH